MIEDPKEIWLCSDCKARVDISGLGFFDLVNCPSCAKKGRVHKKLDHFELKSIIGVGGMSVVLEAYDTLLGRTVAIKILNANCRLDPERIARFEKECKLLARVQHPTIVKVYTAGHARGYFYFAMELLSGQNLEFSVRGHTPTHPFVVLKMAHLLASGLKTAREMGVLHRDLKPGNILLTSAGEAKLIDFGLALAVGECEQGETIWATPFYAAPETLMQQTEDERADIYALGMTLRSILTMKDMFDHVHVPKSSDQWYHAKKTLPSISRILPRLDRDIARLVDHMTNFEVQKRPQNYEILIHEIEDTMEILQAKVSGKYPWQRYQKLVYGASAVTLMSCILSWLPLNSADSRDPISTSPSGARSKGTQSGKGQADDASDAEGTWDINKLKAEKLANQLLEHLNEGKSSELISLATHLSYREEAPLVQLWGLELRWVLSYLESGNDALLEQLSREIAAQKQLIESDKPSSSKLRHDLLLLAERIADRRASGSSKPLELETSKYAMDTFAHIIELNRLETQGHYQQAIALLDTIEKKLPAKGVQGNPLTPQLTLTRHRLSRAAAGASAS